jgi:AcrR family transcriptional regulator
MSLATVLPERRTQASRREEATRSLLDAAAELFARKGIEQTSMADIGEIAGYSRGLPNNHFGSKAVLIEQLIQRCQSRFISLLDQASPQSPPGTSLKTLPKASSGNSRKAIEAIADAYLAHFEHPLPESRALLVLWGASFPLENPVASIHDADRRVRDVIEGLVRSGRRDGSIARSVDPAAFSMLFLGMVRGVSGVLLGNPNEVEFAALRKQLRSLLSAALTPKGN